MTLTDIANHRQNTLDKFKQFIKCYSGVQPALISSLADKLEHICFHIGSPVSLPGMLNSIVEGKIKRWSTGNNYIYGNSKDNDPHEQGGQLKGMSLQHIHRICATYQHKKDKNGNWVGDEMVMSHCGFIQGHFRWNFIGYMANRETRDYINNFWFNPNYVPVKGDNNINELHGTPKLSREQGNPSRLILVVNTTKYRWIYSYDGSKFGGDEKFTTNRGKGDVNSIERESLRQMMKQEKQNQSW